MRRLARRIGALSIWLAAAVPSWAGFNEGEAAFRRGDYSTAFTEASAAAVQDDVQAQALLALLYVAGMGVQKDLRQAEYWSRKAADRGQPTGQYLLGMLYDNGSGVPKDYQIAAFWFRKAADQGVARAQLRLGGMYAEGVGLAHDDEQAMLWFRKAAEQGIPDAQHSLGALYHTGRGVPKDDRQALLWFRKAAEQGYLDSQLSLAGLYAIGEFVPKDDQQAAFWYGKAADQGEPGAQLLLAWRYWLGEGVPMDPQQAYFWLLLSSTRGDATAAKVRELRDAIEQGLTPQQRSRAQAAAREWKPKAPGPVQEFAANVAPEATAAPPPTHREALSSTGTGFFVSAERVVTNNHVIEGCTRLRVGGKSGGLLLNSDPRNDLALISLQDRSPDSATLRTGKVRIGEAALVAGYPLSGLLSGFNVTTGNISSLAGVRGDTRLVQITAPVQPGNSGGPLLDATGRLIGVVVSKLDALKVAESTGDVP